jgi:hypothetical protein
MTFMPRTAAAAFAAAIVFCASPVAVTSASAQQLITEAEAALPPSTDLGMLRRGITRGPQIEVISPSAVGVMSSPIALTVAFKARNTTKIDVRSVKITYLKARLVDLTPRVKWYISEEGIDMQYAEVPPGEHWVRVDVKDSQGRASTEIIKLSVAE